MVRKRHLIIISSITLLFICGFSFSKGFKVLFSDIGKIIFSFMISDSDEQGSNLRIVRNKQVNKYISVYQNEGKVFFKDALERSTKYINLIKKIFNEYDIPESLAYLALIESGYNNTARSYVYATGMWQFMAATGRGYGLRIDNQVDERKDFYRSTIAAARYLRDLYATFSDWYLAIAAYNSGAGYISMKMKQTKSKDFWSLSPHLYEETKQYVPRFIASYIISMHPKYYGFRDVQFKEPIDIKHVKVAGGRELSFISKAYNVSVKKIKDLNPHLGNGRIPFSFNGYKINLPSYVKPVKKYTDSMIVKTEDKTIKFGG